MTKWCFLLMIVCVVDNAHQFPSSDEETRFGSSKEKVNNGAAFELCQNILNKVTEKLRHEGDIYELLQRRGTRVKYWLIGNEPSVDKYWCMSEETPVLRFSWHPGQDHCVNLEISNGTWNFNKYICDVSAESFAVQTKFSDPSFDSETIIQKKAITKRSLESKLVYNYVNLAREIEVTEYSTPTLNVHLNGQLVYSNATEDTSNDVPMDIIEVHINVLPTPPAKTILLSPFPTTYWGAKQDCENRGMRLLTITSDSQTNEAVEAMKKKVTENTEFWTGGKESNDQITWYWSEGDQVNYTNWVSDEPNDPDYIQSCITIKMDGHWIDVNCFTYLYFICESTSEAILPAVKIFVGENLAYQNLPDDESNVIEVKLEVNGSASEDHSTNFLLLKKNSPEGTVLEEKKVFPGNFTDVKCSGVDILVESIKQKDISCQKEKTFHVHTDVKLSHANAQEFCRNLSMQLVSIQNVKQQLEIEKHILKLNLNHYYWTSGFLADNGSSWLWNENESVTYSNWAKGKPDNIGGNEKCIEMYVPQEKAKWNDQECQDKNRIICESFAKPYWHSKK